MKWLGCEDLNLKRPDPESGVLPVELHPKIEAKKYMVSVKKGKDLDYLEKFTTMIVVVRIMK